MKLFLPGAGARMIPSLKSLPEVSSVVVSLNDEFAPGNFLADRAYRLPRFDHPGFFPGVSAIHDLEKFDVCIPVLDAAMLAFTKPPADAFSGRFLTGMSPKAAVRIATDKIEIHRLFTGCGLPTPETWTLPDFLELSRQPFPCFLKPRYAEIRDLGGGIYRRLDDPTDLKYWASKLGAQAKGHVVQPLLTGTEININFFCDADGEVRSIVPIARLAGEPGGSLTRGMILEDTRFDHFCRKLAGAIRLWGSNELQVMSDRDGGVQFTELSVRLNGGSHFLQAAGVDHFANLLRLIRGEPVDFPKGPNLIGMTSWEVMRTFTQSPLRDVLK